MYANSMKDLLQIKSNSPNPSPKKNISVNPTEFNPNPQEKASKNQLKSSLTQDFQNDLLNSKEVTKNVENKQTDQKNLIFDMKIKLPENPNDFIPEILQKILSFFTNEERLTFDLVNKHWHTIVSEERFWKEQCDKNGIKFDPENYYIRDKAKLSQNYKSIYLFYRYPRCRYCFKKTYNYEALGIRAHSECIRNLTTFKTYSEKFFLLDESDYDKLSSTWVPNRFGAPSKMYSLEEVYNYSLKKYGSLEILKELRELRTKKQRERRLAEIRGEVPVKAKKIKKLEDLEDFIEKDKKPKKKKAIVKKDNF